MEHITDAWSKRLAGACSRLADAGNHASGAAELPASARPESKPPVAEWDVAVYAELTRLARAQLARAGTMSLDAPSLVHEAYLRFQRQGVIDPAQRRIFFAYSAQVMRSVIVDYVRERRAQKRGGGEAMLTLTTGVPGVGIDEDGIENMHEALTALGAIDLRAHHVVELRYFGGLTENEIAEVLDVSLPTVKRDWRKARAFLFDAMGSMAE